MALDLSGDLGVFFDTDEFALSATYTPVGSSAISTAVLKDSEPERYFATDGQPLFSPTRTRLTLRVDQVPTSKRGDTVVIGADTWRVDEIEEDDGYTRVVVVRAA